MSWLQSLWVGNIYPLGSNILQYLQTAGCWSWENTVCQIHCHWTSLGPHLPSCLHHRLGSWEDFLVSADTMPNYCKCFDWPGMSWWHCLPETQTRRLETELSWCCIWHLRLEIENKFPTQLIILRKLSWRQWRTDHTQMKRFPVLSSLPESQSSSNPRRWVEIIMSVCDKSETESSKG